MKKCQSVADIILVVVWAFSVAVAGAQTKTAKPKPAAQAPVAFLSDEAVAAALNAWNGASTHFTGLIEREGESTLIHIGSNRQAIAFRASELVGKPARFTPPPEMRRDVVTVVCGDNDRAELFECVSVRVLSSGKAVRHVTHHAANDLYENGFGAKWRARDVVATFRAEGLENGFVVEYTDASGVTRVFDVSAELAAKELLLVLGKPTK